MIKESLQGLQHGMIRPHELSHVRLHGGDVIIQKECTEAKRKTGEAHQCLCFRYCTIPWMLAGELEEVSSAKQASWGKIQRLPGFHGCESHGGADTS